MRSPKIYIRVVATAGAIAAALLAAACGEPTAQPAPDTATEPQQEPAAAPQPEPAAPPRHEAATSTFSFRAVEPPEHAGTVTVTVVDGQTESPLANADVRLGLYRASTDAEGNARIEAPAGDYELYVRRPGYAPCSDPVTVTGDAALRVAAARVTDADLDDDQVWM